MVASEKPASSSGTFLSHEAIPKTVSLPSMYPPSLITMPQQSKLTARWSTLDYGTQPGNSNTTDSGPLLTHTATSSSSCFPLLSHRLLSMPERKYEFISFSGTHNWLKMSETFPKYLSETKSIWEKNTSWSRRVPKKRPSKNKLRGKSLKTSSNASTWSAAPLHKMAWKKCLTRRWEPCSRPRPSQLSRKKRTVDVNSFE